MGEAGFNGNRLLGIPDWLDTWKLCLKEMQWPSLTKSCVLAGGGPASDCHPSVYGRGGLPHQLPEEYVLQCGPIPEGTHHQVPSFSPGLRLLVTPSGCRSGLSVLVPGSPAGSGPPEPPTRSSRVGLSWGSDTGVSLRALGWVSGQTVV